MTALPTRRSTAPGFSLVEVTLAVAIATLAILTLLGLMPQGLEMSRKTGVLTLSSNIIEHLIRDLENTQFNLLPAQGTASSSSPAASVIPDVSYRYFNDQGQEVEQQSQQIAFVAEIDFRSPAALPIAEQIQPNLRRVIIRIAPSANAEFKFGDDNRLAYSTFNHLLAKTR